MLPATNTLNGFVTGICVGIALTVSINYLHRTVIHQSRTFIDKHTFAAFFKSNVTNSANLDDERVDEKVVYSDIFPPKEYNSIKIHQGERDLSDAINSRIRVSCFVMTQPKDHKTKAAAVLATWGKRCNVFHFVSTQEVNFGSDNRTGGHLPHVKTAVYRSEESRDILWNKTVTGFLYAYDNYFDEADWFVKADDDTFVILENLRLLLLDKDPSLPVYYGCRFRAIIKSGYMSGGAGYVLSKEALRRFAEDWRIIKNSEDFNGEEEDVAMGICMDFIGVKAGDSRDWVGLQRFFSVDPVALVLGTISGTAWYFEYMWYPHDLGVECCSDSVISFHYISVDMMWVMEYLVYHVHPFGIHPKLTGANVKNKIETYLKQMKQCNVTKSKY